jgi:hypothetical protein
MTITTEDAKTFTAKKTEKSKVNFAESQLFTVFSQGERSPEGGAGFPEYGPKQGTKLDLSTSDLNDSLDAVHERGRLSNIREDSREYEDRSERKESLTDSGVDPSVLENGLYSRPFLISNNNSGPIECLEVPPTVNMQKKRQTPKQEVHASKNTTLLRHSTEKTFDNSNNVIQKIESILNRRQKKNEKLQLSITQSPKLKRMVDGSVTKKHAGMQAAKESCKDTSEFEVNATLKQPDANSGSKTKLQKLKDEKRSGSATILYLNTSIYGGLPKETVQTLDGGESNKDTEISFDIQAKLSRSTKRLRLSPKLGPLQQLVKPHLKDFKPKPESVALSTYGSVKFEAGSARKSPVSSLGTRLGLDGQSYSLSQSKADIDQTQNRSLATAGKKSHKESTHSKLNSSTFTKNDRSVNQTIKPFSGSPLGETSRTSLASTRLKPKKINELREETQVIISRLMGKKKPIPSPIVESKAEPMKNSLYLDALSMPEMDKEASTSLFSVNFMKAAAPKPSKDSSLNLNRDILYNKKHQNNLYKQINKSTDPDSFCDDVRPSGMRAPSLNPSFTNVKHIYSSSFKSPKSNLVNPPMKASSKAKLNLLNSNFTTPQNKMSFTSSAVDNTGSNTVKEAPGILKKVRESPFLLAKVTPKKTAKLLNAVDLSRLKTSS